MYTELELVNHILHTRGEDTTPTLETTHPSVVTAKQTLASFNKEVQGKGWWFNTDYAVKLLPNVAGKVVVPAGVLKFTVTRTVQDAASPKDKLRYVRRGGFVYDTWDHTDVLNRAVWADLVVLLDYEDIPEAAGSYLKHYSAAQSFLADDGDVQQKRELDRLVQEAWAFLRKHEIDAQATNALESPAAQNLLYGPGAGYGRNPYFIGGYMNKTRS